MGPFAPTPHAFMGVEGASGSGTRCGTCFEEAYPFLGDGMHGGSHTDEEDGDQYTATDTPACVMSAGNDLNNTNQLG